MDAKLEFSFINFSDSDFDEAYRRVPVVCKEEKKFLSLRSNRISVYKAVSGIQFQKTGASKETRISTPFLSSADDRRMSPKSKQNLSKPDLFSDLDRSMFPGSSSTVPRLLKLDLKKLASCQSLAGPNIEERGPVKTLNLSPRFPSKHYIRTPPKQDNTKTAVPSPFQFRAALPVDARNKIKRTSSLSPNFHRRVFKDAGITRTPGTPTIPRKPNVKRTVSLSPLRSILTTSRRLTKMFSFDGEAKQRDQKPPSGYRKSSSCGVEVQTIRVEDAINVTQMGQRIYTSKSEIILSPSHPVRPLRKKSTRRTSDENGIDTVDSAFSSIDISDSNCEEQEPYYVNVSELRANSRVSGYKYQSEDRCEKEGGRRGSDSSARDAAVISKCNQNSISPCKRTRVSSKECSPPVFSQSDRVQMRNNFARTGIRYKPEDRVRPTPQDKELPQKPYRRKRLETTEPERKQGRKSSDLATKNGRTIIVQDPESRTNRKNGLDGKSQNKPFATKCCVQTTSINGNHDSSIQISINAEHVSTVTVQKENMSGTVKSLKQLIRPNARVKREDSDKAQPLLSSESFNLHRSPLEERRLNLRTVAATDPIENFPVAEEESENELELDGIDMKLFEPTISSSSVGDACHEIEHRTSPKGFIYIPPHRDRCLKKLKSGNLKDRIGKLFSSQKSNGHDGEMVSLHDTIGQPWIDGADISPQPITISPPKTVVLFKELKSRENELDSDKTISEKPISHSHQPACHGKDRKEPLVSWEPYFCVLVQDDQTLTAYGSEEIAAADTAYSELPKVRLDGGSRNFHKHWANGNENTPAPLIEETEECELDGHISDDYRGSPIPPDSPEFNIRPHVQARKSMSCRMPSSPTSGRFELFSQSTIRKHPHFLGSADGLSSSDDYEKSSLGSDTSYDKACGGVDRRSSAPSTPVLGHVGNTRPVTESQTSKLANFFSKRSFKSNPLKRTKSVTKLERKRGLDFESPGRLRASRSHESLLCVGVTGNQKVIQNLDLTDCSVKPLHPSLLGENCFEIRGPDKTTYVACKHREETESWIKCLQKSIFPYDEQARRVDNSLTVWILEAKGIPPKKRYYCTLCVDGTEQCRTATKTKTDMCFWGQNFEFNSRDPIDNVFVHLNREVDKKKRKDKNSLIGTVKIEVRAITSRFLIEKWYPVEGANGKEAPALRIKCKFQVIDILPLSCYDEFTEFLCTNYVWLCEQLEPTIGVKAKEDLATSLVAVMQRYGLAHSFLADLVASDIQKMDDKHLIFRGNSLATKATEAYMKLTGETYLRNCLADVLRSLIDRAATKDCEVDPLRVTSQALLVKQQAHLRNAITEVWGKVLGSVPYFPAELRACFNSFRMRLAQLGRADLTDHLISASIFLRFLCPAVLSPSLFRITTEYPSERCSRNLTLVAKVLQTLANFTRFQGKESFMEFMNDFLEKEAEVMKRFLQEISSPVPAEQLHQQSNIDAGKHLSLLHTLLCESLPKLVSRAPGDPRLERLQFCLNSITGLLGQPNGTALGGSTLYPPFGCQNSPQRGGLERPQYQSLQRSVFRYNDPSSTVDRLTVPIDDQRASTLPRPAQSPAKEAEMKRAILEFADGLRYVDDSPDIEPDKGSNMSISQLSNVASSGYQSITSSSPVDQGIHGENLLNANNVNNNNVNKRSLNTSSPNRTPVAFTNPVYQMGIGSTGARTIPRRYGLAAHSVEDVRVPRLALAPSPNLRTHGSTSSSDSASCISTPPTERRAFKPSAPRTNPRVAYPGPPASVPHSIPSLNMDNYSLNQDNLNRRKQRLMRRGTTESTLNSTISNASTYGQLARQRLGGSVQTEWDSDESSPDERMLERVVRPPRSQRGSRQALDRTLPLLLDNGDASSEYEREIIELRGAMEELEYRLSRAEQLYIANPGGSPVPPSQAPHGEIRDEHLKAMINRLVTLENELQREKQQMADKQRVIEAQVQTIKALDSANSRLLGALAQLRDRGIAPTCAQEKKEGEVDKTDPTPLLSLTQRILADFGDMQSSSC